MDSEILAGYQGLSPVLHGTQAFQFLLDAFVVVVVDVSVQRVAQLLHAGKAFEPEAFGLEGAEEAFHGRVIEAINEAQFFGGGTSAHSPSYINEGPQVGPAALVPEFHIENQIHSSGLASESHLHNANDVAMLQTGEIGDAAAMGSIASICSVCKSKNRTIAKYCRHCGNALDAPWTG